MKLSDIGEKSLISTVIRKNNKKSKGTLPLNDDAQLIIPPNSYGNPLVVATDRTPTDLRPYIWGIYDLYHYGKYNVISNLSDMAAMGAIPFGYLLNVAAPADMLLEDFKTVFSGVQSTLHEYDTELLGGDTKEGKELSLVGVAIGQCQTKSALIRSGASPGDKLIMSNQPLGAIPAAHAFFSRYNSKKSSPIGKKLADCFHLLYARINEAKKLAESGVCTSCIDNSDGLLASLEELSSASNVGFSLEEKNFEIDDSALNVATKLKRDPIFLALGAGGDFRLIATVERLKEELKETFIEIGEVREQEISFQKKSISEGEITKWNHFKK